ncbi:MAG: hypothetical protein DRO62_02110 [Candidatus Altiarchaeales archaeon]|nr:MAG: hypothetical protein DRO62_02110 [Candidatus Altiarchaeales archaeon]
MDVKKQEVGHEEIFEEVNRTKTHQGHENLYESSSTGVKGLDKLLGGGFPKGSVVLLAGSSGSGKTIFSFQWLFEGVKNGENGIYITVTEPLFKTLKNLEVMNFYDRNAIEREKLKIIDIREIYEDEGFNLERIINFIEEQVRQNNARRLCIDSITAIAYNLDNKAKIRKFIFELGKVIATLGCTTVLTSEVVDRDRYSVYNVEEFISDAIIKLAQIRIGDELQRVMRIVKIRGRGCRSDDLYFKISGQGIRVFPKLDISLNYKSSTERVSTGNEALDDLLSGGIFRGSSTLIAGPTGTGKSLLSMQFIIEGLERGEPCLYAGFEESRDQLIRNAKGFGWDLEKYEKNGLLTLRCVYPREKHIEEHLADMGHIVEGRKINRCVIDSLSAIENSFPEENFTDFVIRVNGYLKMQNVTTFFTSAATSLIGSRRLTENHISTIADNIIMLKHVEMQGELGLVINIIKARGSSHSKRLIEYRITDKGIAIGQCLYGYEGIIGGMTRKTGDTVEDKLESEFEKFIGSETESVFPSLKSEGFSKENIFACIDKLIKKEILKKNNGIELKEDVKKIMR